MGVFVCVCVCLCVFGCVCVCERERQRERQKKNQRESMRRERDGEREGYMEGRGCRERYLLLMRFCSHMLTPPLSLLLLLMRLSSRATSSARTYLVAHESVHICISGECVSVREFVCVSLCLCMCVCVCVCVFDRRQHGWHWS